MRCGAIGAFMVGGRVVGQLRCEREAGHDVARKRERWMGTDTTLATPHGMTLTWTPEAEPDLDLFDPDEVMVDPMPRNLEAEIQHDGPLGEACPACGRRHPGPASPGVCDQ